MARINFDLPDRISNAVDAHKIAHGNRYDGKPPNKDDIVIMMCDMALPEIENQTKKMIKEFNDYQK